MRDRHPNTRPIPRPLRAPGIGAWSPIRQFPGSTFPRAHHSAPSSRTGAKRTHRNRLPLAVLGVMAERLSAPHANSPKRSHGSFYLTRPNPEPATTCPNPPHHLPFCKTKPPRAASLGILGVVAVPLPPPRRASSQNEPTRLPHPCFCLANTSKLSLLK